MPKLTKEHKRFIVRALACFDTPKQVADAVKEEFGFVLSRQSVQFYDPTVGPRPGKEWIAIFEETRKTFLDEAAKEPVAHRAVRVRRLARMAERAESKGNTVLAASLYEQIAKEVGDSFTNKRDVNAKVGGSLEVHVTRRLVRADATP